MTYFIAGFITGALVCGGIVAYIGHREMEKIEQKRRKALQYRRR